MGQLWKYTEIEFSNRNKFVIMLDHTGKQNTSRTKINDLDFAGQAVAHLCPPVYKYHN